MAALRSSDGAILDPDDRLADVVDDREQLAACLSNGGSGSELDEASLGVPLVLGPRIGLMNLRGDGTSASSNSGSPSPTDFGLHHQHYGGSHHPSSRKDIEVTGQEAATGLMVDHLHLQVRRGSEPALNRISPDGPTITNGPASAAGQHHQADVPPTSNTRDYKVMCKHDYTRLYFLFPSDVARESKSLAGQKASSTFRLATCHLPKMFPPSAVSVCFFVLFFVSVFSPFLFSLYQMIEKQIAKQIRVNYPNRFHPIIRS